MPCMRISFLTLLTVLALAGCSTSGGDKPASATGNASAALPASASSGRCDSDLARFAVGQQASSALLQQAQQRSGAQVARILRPADVVTLEYRSERVNLSIDAQGVVTRVNCG